MKGAFYLSFDDAIVEKLCRALGGVGEIWEGCRVRYAAPDAIQVQELGTDHLFSFDQYDDRPEYAKWYREPPHIPEPGVTVPDMTAILGYGIDCRWEDLFARLCRAVTDISGQPAWIIDENDVLWDARNVDPDRVHL